MGNQTQAAAKAAKNDEFYTQYHDIEIEVNAYLEYDTSATVRCSVRPTTEQRATDKWLNKNVGCLEKYN